MSKNMKTWFVVVILLLVGAVGIAEASPPIAASATFTQTATTDSAVGFAGPNTIIEATNEGSVSGTLNGSFVDDIRVVIHPDGLFTAQGKITCQCVVAGKEGVLELRVVDTGEPVNPTTSIFVGSAVITGATGELVGLHGVMQVEGTVDLVTGLSTYTLSGQIHFDP